MPDVEDLATSHAAQLLGRLELGDLPATAAQWLSGRRVLITGAGGSVGRPLTAAILAANPDRLVLIDHHEASLFELHRRFGNNKATTLLLADIRNQSRLTQTLQQWQPETVFHLAAYKHVAFGELFSDEAFGVNVLATRSFIRLAADMGVERFVYPSSDKACKPPSLYGATKRLCETLVRQTARRSGLRYNVARFVNILGTQGSVIETFAQQVRSGKPLTVTDPAMTRYWISMNEALWLLLSTGGLDSGEQTVMLDAPQEVRVVEMARRVSELLAATPGEDPRIVYSTPGPGERLHEELLSASERFEPGPRAGLLRVLDSQADQHLNVIDGLLDELASIAEGGPQKLREMVMAAAHELQ